MQEGHTHIDEKTNQQETPDHRNGCFRLFKFKDCSADDFPSLITIGHYNLVVRVCGKMVRHCYRCKSASHLVRDCPEPDTRSHDHQAEMDADANASEPYPLRERADSPWTYDGRSCAGTPELPYLEVDNSILDGDGKRDASLGAPSSSCTVDNSDVLLGSEEVVGEELTSQNDEEGRLPAQAPTLADDSTPDETSHCAPDPHVNDKVTNPSADSSHSVATTSLQTSGTADWAEATLSANRDHSYFDTGDKDNPVFVEPPPKRSKRRKQTQRYARSLSSSQGRSMRSRSRSKEPNVIIHEGEPMMPYRMRDGTTVMRKLRRAVGAGAAGAAMAAPLFVASPSQTLLCASERERRGKTNTYKEAFNLKPD